MKKGVRTVYYELMHEQNSSYFSWYEFHDRMIELGYFYASVDRNKILENHNKVNSWCSAQFGHKHYILVFNLFFSRIYFSREEDLAFFLMRWSGQVA